MKYLSSFIYSVVTTWFLYMAYATHGPRKKMKNMNDDELETLFHLLNGEDIRDMQILHPFSLKGLLSFGFIDDKFAVTPFGVKAFCSSQNNSKSLSEALAYKKASYAMAHLMSENHRECH